MSRIEKEHLLNQFRRVDGEIFEGDEKQVFRATDGKKNIALKIYRTRNNFWSSADIAEKANQDFLDHTKMYQSPLHQYVPEPYYLVKDTDGKNVIGIAVEWRTGTTLANLEVAENSSETLTKEDIQELFQAIMAATKKGIFLVTDMLNAWNLGFDPDREPKLYFTECEILSNTLSPQEIARYERQIKAIQTYLELMYVIQ